MNRFKFRFHFTVPFLSRQMTGYDIRYNAMRTGKFKLVVAIGSDFNDVRGVGRISWFPFMIWQWVATDEAKIAEEGWFNEKS